jgi:hypothetical protein
MLARPADQRIEQAGDADPMRQSNFDGGYDEGGCQAAQRALLVGLVIVPASPHECESRRSEGPIGSWSDRD